MNAKPTRSIRLTRRGWRWWAAGFHRWWHMLVPLAVIGLCFAIGVRGLVNLTWALILAGMAYALWKVVAWVPGAVPRNPVPPASKRQITDPGLIRAMSERRERIDT